MRRSSCWLLRRSWLIRRGLTCADSGGLGMSSDTHCFIAAPEAEDGREYRACMEPCLDILDIPADDGRETPGLPGEDPGGDDDSSDV
mmetsp:Transcript_37651/g.66201  ORF Transcript_37651/g.66201 Transcript_37651/m.66201 type:complete len:87 (+) Transcript_37651:84-344(+)